MARETIGAERKIRLLLVDDHPVVREGLASLLGRQEDMAVVGSASSGEEAVALCATSRPDVVLMDLRMPGKGGVEATRVIADRFPKCSVLVLTTFDGDEEIYQALRAGARGYLLKDAHREELVDAIRGVYAGKRWIPPAVADKLAQRVAGSQLTSREVEILALVAAGNSNKRIAGRLGITEGTVKGHLNSILGKLAADDRTEAVTRAVRRGILRLDQEPGG
jgi:two-component system, NarL family, response regulator